MLLLMAAGILFASRPALAQSIVFPDFSANTGFLRTVQTQFQAQSDTQRKPSTCLAVADRERTPRILPASLTLANDARFTVNIRYATHSTYRITTPEKIIIATDFAGIAGTGRLPDVVTMNHAHSTHFTNNPDPSIPHVLRGWGNGVEPAEHYLEVGDALVRNVPTDLYRGGMLVEENGNSIFIFEVAGLCIGHLGHLHHLLTPEQFAEIGRLDVLMLPVDGSYTLSIEGMSDLARRFRSSVILPMHWFSGYSLRRFVENVQTSFEVTISNGSDIDLNLRNLPATPTVIVLEPEMGAGFGAGWDP